MCGGASTWPGTSMLTNIILSLFQGNLLGEGLLVWLLAIVLGGMAILLGVQMAVRLALIWVLLVLAGPGLACLALSQTVGYGRLWLSLTASTVMVQFFQVVTLALGGTLITAIGVTNILGLDSTLATLLDLYCPALPGPAHPWHRQSLGLAPDDGGLGGHRRGGAGSCGLCRQCRATPAGVGVVSRPGAGKGAHCMHATKTVLAAFIAGVGLLSSWLAFLLSGLSAALASMQGSGTGPVNRHHADSTPGVTSNGHARSCCAPPAADTDRNSPGLCAAERVWQTGRGLGAGDGGRPLRQSGLSGTHQLPQLLLYLVQGPRHRLPTRRTRLPAGGHPVRAAGLSGLCRLGQWHLPVRQLCARSLLPGLSHDAHRQCLCPVGTLRHATGLGGDPLGGGSPRRTRYAATG